MATSGSGTGTPITGGTGTTLATIVSRLRQRLDDVNEPHLWSNDELTELIARLQRELVVELQLLPDRETSGIALMTVAQGMGAFTMDPRIVEVKHAELDGTDLTIVSSDTMDKTTPGWDDATVVEDVPTTLVVDVGRLYPPMAAATGTLRMIVTRRPLLDLDYGSHSELPLEIDVYVPYIYSGVMNLAYAKHDTDAESLPRAAYHAAQWKIDHETIRREVLRTRVGVHTQQYSEGII